MTERATEQYQPAGEPVKGSRWATGLAVYRSAAEQS